MPVDRDDIGAMGASWNESHKPEVSGPDIWYKCPLPASRGQWEDSPNEGRAGSISFWRTGIPHWSH